MLVAAASNDPQQQLAPVGVVRFANLDSAHNPIDVVKTDLVQAGQYGWDGHRQPGPFEGCDLLFSHSQRQSSGASLSCLEHKSVVKAAALAPAQGEIADAEPPAVPVPGSLDAVGGAGVEEPVGDDMDVAAVGRVLDSIRKVRLNADLESIPGTS